MFVEGNQHSLGNYDMENDQTRFLVNTNKEIIDELNTQSPYPISLLFLPTRYWIAEDYEALNKQVFHGKLRGIVTHFANESRSAPIIQAKHPEEFKKSYQKAVSLLTETRIGQTKSFLSRVFQKIDILDLQNFNVQNNLISKVVKLFPDHKNNLILLDLIGRKGWLQAQSILQVAILSTKLDILLERHESRPIKPKEIICEIDAALAPLYLASGKELQTLWVPNFLYVIEYPDMCDSQEVKPAHFDCKATSITEEICLSFIKELDRQTSVNWCKVFAYSLGLLD